MAEIANPRRILAVSLVQDEELLRQITKDLTGSAPSPGTPLAGETVKYSVTTKYYKADIPIWLDTMASAAEWVATFLEPEAQEVLQAVGGFLVVFPVPPKGSSMNELRELLEQMKRLMDLGFGDQWDGVSLAVGVGEHATTSDVADENDIERLCSEICGWQLEYIQVGKGTHAEDDDGFKVDLDRIHEALQTSDWEQLPDPDEANSDDSFQDWEMPEMSGAELDLAKLDPENMDFGFDKDDMEELKKAILSTEKNDTAPIDNSVAGPSRAKKQAEDLGVQPDSDLAVNPDEIAKLEGMMRKLQAARDAGVDMSEAQRKKMAARAVAEVMRDL